MKQCLLWRWQCLSFVLIAPALVVVASPDAGYLPRIGPAPFRFIASHWPCTNRFVFPSVPAPASAPAVPAAQKVSPLPAPSPTVPAPATPAAALPTNGPAAQSPVESAPPDGMIPAQLFLKYFSKSTNVDNSVAAPQDSTSPKPYGSSATYSTGQ